MGLKVVKFGGSSLADAAQMKKVKAIIDADAERRFVIPSAPGKRHSEDTKITDLLYRFHQAVEFGGEYRPLYDAICARYFGICEELGLELDIKGELERILENVVQGASRDYVASRGEYLNGLILAEYLNMPFVDAKDIICFDKKGKYDAAHTQELVASALQDIDSAVIPGFYGALPDGRVKTFSRGGSDITGAIVAGALRADIYENWTDVSGFLTADPRIVKDPKKIGRITYRELRELSYMGASVLHEDAIFPVFQAAIPINIRNTNDPENSGSLIVPMIEDEDEIGVVTGIAGKKNFTVISIEKNGMNSELGFGRRVLASIEKYGIPFEHMPSSIDTLCVVLEDSKIGDNLSELVDDIYRACDPDSIEVHANMALIATVGRGMVRQVGLAAKLFAALANAKINIRMIDQGSSEMNIIVGVENDDFENAVRAIYEGVIGRE